MAITLYEKTSGALVPSGERTVATYDSGLVRVDQTYICSHASAATHRAALIIGAAMPDGNSDPAIDGLYIFPVPQEVKKPDGFTEFRVSAYGRVKDVLQNVSVESREFSAGDLAFELKVTTGSIVLPAGTALTSDVIGFDADSFDPYNFVYKSSYAWIVTISGIYDYRTLILRADAVSAFGSNSSNNDVPINVRARYFNIIADGVVANETHEQGSVIILDPIWKIKSQRNFGRFSELDIESEISSPSIYSAFEEVQS